MELILIRHPAVALPAGICYGHSDVPLALPPQAEITRLATRLESLCVGRTPQFHASPLSRCTEIAGPLAVYFGAQVRIDPRLREINFGRWEMQAWDAIPRSEIEYWAADVEHACRHGGESVAVLSERVQSWLAELEFELEVACRAQTAAQSVVVLTHAGVMRVLAALTLRLPLAVCLDWQLELGAICHLRRRWRGDGWTLVSWNY